MNYYYNQKIESLQRAHRNEYNLVHLPCIYLLLPVTVREASSMYISDESVSGFQFRYDNTSTIITKNCEFAISIRYR